MRRRITSIYLAARNRHVSCDQRYCTGSFIIAERPFIYLRASISQHEGRLSPTVYLLLVPCSRATLHDIF